MSGPCKICGAEAPYGFWNKANHAWLWYCMAHKSQGVADPPEKRAAAQQQSLELGEAGQFDRFVKGGTYSWETRFVAFIRYMIKAGETDTGETWRHQAAYSIGAPPTPNAVGAATLRAAKAELIEKTGRYVAPRDRASHGSRKPEWRRTDVK